MASLTAKVLTLTHWSNVDIHLNTSMPTFALFSLCLTDFIEQTNGLRGPAGAGKSSLFNPGDIISRRQKY